MLRLTLRRSSVTLRGEKISHHSLHLKPYKFNVHSQLERRWVMSRSVEEVVFVCHTAPNANSHPMVTTRSVSDPSAVVYVRNEVCVSVLDA